MTSRTRILTGMAVALIVGYLLGYYLGGGVHTSQHQTLTSRELTCLSTYAATLQTLEENQPTEASHLLQDRLRASVSALHDLTTRPIHVESPEFARGLRQAEAYARRHGLSSFTLKALANFSPGFALKPWGIGFTFIWSQL